MLCFQWELNRISSLWSEPTAPGAARPLGAAAAADLLALAQLAALVILILQRWIIVATEMTHTPGWVKKCRGALRAKRVCSRTLVSTSPALDLWVGSRWYKPGDGLRRVAGAGAQPQWSLQCCGAVGRVEWSRGRMMEHLHSRDALSNQQHTGPCI